MPQTHDWLREKFMKDGSDGIGEAILVIEKAGHSVSKSFIIKLAKVETSQDVLDAIQVRLPYWVPMIVQNAIERSLVEGKTNGVILYHHFYHGGLVSVCYLRRFGSVYHWKIVPEGD